MGDVTRGGHQGAAEAEEGPGALGGQIPRSLPLMEEGIQLLELQLGLKPRGQNLQMTKCGFLEGKRPETSDSPFLGTSDPICGTCQTLLSQVGMSLHFWEHDHRQPLCRNRHFTLNVWTA